jgi:hypothetical protein
MPFPTSPTNGQIATVNGIKYFYSALYTAWIRILTANFTASANAPTTASVGDHWYDTNEDVLYEWINDGTSVYWVDISSGLVSGTTTVSLPTVLPFHPFLLSGM